jgi:hypothetical protein
MYYLKHEQESFIRYKIYIISDKARTASVLNRLKTTHLMSLLAR